MSSTRQLMIQALAFYKDFPSEAFDLICEQDDVVQRFTDKFGRDFKNFQLMYSSLPPAELIKQFLFSYKLSNEGKYQKMFELARDKLYGALTEDGASSQGNTQGKFQQSSHLEGAPGGNISISVFGPGERVKSKQTIERHSLTPGLFVDAGAAGKALGKARANGNNSIISTTVYTAIQGDKRPKTAATGRKGPSLTDVLMQTKQNEVERIQLNKRLTQLQKEVQISENAILQVQQEHQSLFKEIRRMQTQNLELQKKQAASGVNKQNSRYETEKVQRELDEAKKTLKRITEALQRVTTLNSDFKLQLLGNGHVEQLESLYQQLLGTTEEHIFTAGKDEQVVIYQEVLEDDSGRNRLKQQEKRLNFEIQKLEAEIQGYQNALATGAVGQ